MNEETKEWEVFEDDDSEFQILKDGDKISFKFNEVFPDDAGKYKVCEYFVIRFPRFPFSSARLIMMVNVRLFQLFLLFLSKVLDHRL